MTYTKTHGSVFIFNIVSIPKDLCEGAILYADLIHEKLKQAGYYDDIGVFDVTEQVR